MHNDSDQKSNIGQFVRSIRSVNSMKKDLTAIIELKVVGTLLSAQI